MRTRSRLFGVLPVSYRRNPKASPLIYGFSRVAPDRLCNLSFLSSTLSELMKSLFRFIFVCSSAGAFQLPATQAESSAGKLVLGIVSFSANEANNQRFIQAATKEAATKGWNVSVIDAAASADQANAAFRIWLTRHRLKRFGRKTYNGRRLDFPRGSALELSSHRPALAWLEIAGILARKRVTGESADGLGPLRNIFYRAIIMITEPSFGNTQGTGTVQ